MRLLPSKDGNSLIFYPYCGETTGLCANPTTIRAYNHLVVSRSKSIEIKSNPSPARPYRLKYFSLVQLWILKCGQHHDRWRMLSP